MKPQKLIPALLMWLGLRTVRAPIFHVGAAGITAIMLVTIGFSAIVGTICHFTILAMSIIYAHYVARISILTSFYVYHLHWPDTVYHGYAKQLQRRLAEHRSRCRKGTEHNSVIQDYYDYNGMWYDVTYEEFDNKEDALAYERELVNSEAGTDYCLNAIRDGK